MARLYIRINNDFCKKVDKYSKIDSVKFEDFWKFFREIIDSFNSDDDLNMFRLNLYNVFKTKVEVKCVKKSEVINWEVVEDQWFSLNSPILAVDSQTLWKCLPLYVRKQFFVFDSQLQKLLPKTDLVYYLY